ncbi:TetR/AcrR family transcriptional regulator [Pseudonocardiaceae bacterium YIM PH 21723]|nr:TetR/AcrR family transcriptional regulator [Pseudonocardiaceae bacterium YIM PH 21723]
MSEASNPEEPLVPIDVAPLRRRPVQQRSAQRVERMLDACADLINEVGYDGVTTTLIAERAGVAVGSLYQFFPDKRAVVQSLTLRNLDRFLAAVSEKFATVELTNWWDGVDTMIDVYVSMHREIPGFSRVHFGDIVDLRLLDERKDNNAVIADRLSGMLRDRFGIRHTEFDLRLGVAVEAADAVLNLAFRRSPEGDPALIAEAKALVRGYLSSTMD